MLKKLEARSNGNLLAVNVAKSKIVIFGLKNKICTISNDLYCRLDRLKIAKTFRSLGLVISEHMQSDEHIRNVISKASRAVRPAYHHRNILPQTVKLVLYWVLFYNNLDYYTLVWATTTNTNLQKLSVLKKRCLEYHICT